MEHPFISLLILTSLIYYSSSTETITPNQVIADGQTLVSSAGAFALGFFSLDPLSKSRYLGIWYRNIPIQTVVWVANGGSPLTDATGVLNLTDNGNLVLCNRSGHTFWSTNTSNLNNPIVKLLDSGNLVLTEGSIPKWQSFDHPSNALLPGMKLGWDSTTNINRKLTSWKSPSDPQPGPYSYKLDLTGMPEIFLRNGSVPVCRSGPWNGQGFDGLPSMSSNNYFAYQLVNDSHELYYQYEADNTSFTTLLFLDSVGVLQRLVWLGHQWSSYRSFPSDKCDDYAACGSYGVCHIDSVFTCECVKGFEPRLTEKWVLRDFSGGCLRRVGLDCGKESGSSDGFLKVSGLKLPDASNASVNGSMDFYACRNWCLKDCACKAFAISGGSGCVIWVQDLLDIRQFADGGEDLYVRLAASELGIRREFSEEISGQEMEVTLFDISTIKSATDRFSVENILGKGGFGLVYKGQLVDGQEIAVKRLSTDSSQGPDEFKNEVMLIAKLQHRNLVQLLGCCIHGAERMLIYEFMPNNSLDAFIFDKAKRALLDWRKRINIIVGIARGLLYLHQDSRFNIIHRDIKASNILLDKEMNPKISDFGTARIFRRDKNQESTKRVIGTYGYMSPEYAMDGVYSVKSDVFSFGVVVLEILSGKKNRAVYEAEPHMNLLGHAWSLWMEDKCLELLDESVECSCPKSEVLRCMQVGLLCVQEGRDDRPTMSSVVLMLGSKTVELPQPKKPGFCTTSIIESGPTCTDQSLRPTNKLTITTLEGR